MLVLRQVLDLDRSVLAALQGRPLALAAEKQSLITTCHHTTQGFNSQAQHPAHPPQATAKNSCTVLYCTGANTLYCRA